MSNSTICKPLSYRVGQLRRFALVACLAVASSAFAQSIGGTITYFIPFSDTEADPNPVLLFKLSSSIAEGCNTYGRFAISSTSPRYKATLAAIIAAYHAQTTVKVRYALTCNASDASYDALYICSGDC